MTNLARQIFRNDKAWATKMRVAGSKKPAEAGFFSAATA